MPSLNETWEVQSLEDEDGEVDTHPNERVVISSDGGEVCTILLGGLAQEKIDEMNIRAHRIASLPTIYEKLGKIRLLIEDSPLLTPIGQLVDEALEAGKVPDGR